MLTLGRPFHRRCLCYQRRWTVRALLSSVDVTRQASLRSVAAAAAVTASYAVCMSHLIWQVISSTVRYVSGQQIRSESDPLQFSAGCTRGPQGSVLGTPTENLPGSLPRAFVMLSLNNVNNVINFNH